MSDERALELIPVAVDVFDTAEAQLGEESDERYPVIGLAFDEYPQAGTLFRSLIDESETTTLTAEVEVWIPLLRDAGPQAHEGHPTLRFLLVPDPVPGPGPVEALAFRICAQCEPATMADLCRTDQFMIIGPTPFDYDGDSGDEPLGDMLSVSCDPDWVANRELWAWRHAYSGDEPE
jgi:hypothetical protein